MEITKSERGKAVDILKQVVLVNDWIREANDEGIEGRITVDEEQMIKAMKMYAEQERERTSEAHGEVSPLEALVSLLKERKNYYSEKSERLLLSDKNEQERDEFKDAVFMYGNYINVIADIRNHLKGKAG